MENEKSKVMQNELEREETTLRVKNHDRWLSYVKILSIAESLHKFFAIKNHQNVVNLWKLNALKIYSEETPLRFKKAIFFHENCLSHQVPTQWFLC